MQQYGTSEKANTAGKGTPVLRIVNIKDGAINTSELKHIVLPEKTKAGLLLHEGDVLIIRTSGSRDLVGTCASFHEKGEFVYASYLIRLRPDPKRLDADFLAWFLNSPSGRQQVDATSRHIMMNNINMEEISGFQIPLPPLNVQQKIMKGIGDHLLRVAELRGAADKETVRAKDELEELILGTKKVTQPTK